MHSCGEMERQRKNFEDRARALESRLFRERQAVERKEAEVRQMESELRIAETQSRTAIGASRVFGPVGGTAVTALSKTAFAYKIAEIRERLRPARSDLERLKTRLSEQEKELGNLKGLAGGVLDRMQNAGCPGT